MTQTYAQVTKQIAELQSKAEQLKKREVDGVVDRIKAAIRTYGLTASQLFGSAGGGGRKAAAAGGKRVAKQRYGDDKGNVWGGMGPRPRWLRDALAEGRKLEEFAVDGAEAPAANSAPAKGKKAKRGGKRGKRRAARQAYSNGTYTWSGYGRQPTWLKESLAGGKTLDEMKA